MTTTDSVNPNTNDRSPYDESLELLASACEIARRAGSDTNWPGFLASLEKCLARHGIRGVTARTYRALPTE